jgi:hypothetical protein
MRRRGRRKSKELSTPTGKVLSDAEAGRDARGQAGAARRYAGAFSSTWRPRASRTDAAGDIPPVAGV